MDSLAASGVVQLDEYRWMLPKEGDMRVPGILFADRPLLERRVIVRHEGRDTLRDETSEAYKDVADVVRVVAGADLARPVARLKPFIVVKG